MRLIAVIPTVLCTVALVLSFLCLFAGSKKNFMEGYAVITLNTSRIGANLTEEVFNSILNRRADLSLDVEGPTKIQERDTPNAIESLASQATESIGDAADDLGDDVQDGIDDAVTELGQLLNLHDFYSAHILNFCKGYYKPGPMVNETVPKGSITKNVTSCSNKTAMYHFDPKSTLAEELKNKTDGAIDLTDLRWPDEIDDAIDALEMASNAVFVLYCMAIGLIFLGLIAAVFGIFSTGRMGAVVNGLIDMLAFLAILFASALVTTIAVKATHAINKYGDVVSIQATKGNRFLALTWSATGLVMLAGLVWSFEFFRAWKTNRASRTMRKAKHGESSDYYH